MNSSLEACETGNGTSGIPPVICNVSFLSIIGRSISIWALIVALLLFSTLRLMENNPRLLHIQLFISNIFVDACLLPANIYWVINCADNCINCNHSKSYALPANEPAFYILEFFQFYFIMSNTFWSTCEALYLILVIWQVIFNEALVVKLLYAFGWGAPILLLILFVLINSYEILPFYSLYEGSLATSLLINIVALAYVFIFLRNGTQSLKPSSIRAFKALTLLVPLFGVHYLLLDFIPVKEGWLCVFQRFLIGIVSSFQGLILALIFCFTNGEVRNGIKQALRRGSRLFRESSSKENTASTTLNRATYI